MAATPATPRPDQCDRSARPLCVCTLVHVRRAARARRREARGGTRVDSAQSVDAQGRVCELRAEQVFLAEVWPRVERLGGRLEDLSVVSR